MSASPDFMQGLLQSLGGHQGGGITGGLMGNPDNLFAASLMANSNTPGTFSGILGRSLLQSNDLQYQNRAQQLDLAQKALALGLTGQRMNAINQYLSPEQVAANQAVAQTGGNAAPMGLPGAAAATMPSAPMQRPGMPGPGMPPSGQLPPGINAPSAPNAGALAQRTPFDVPLADVYSTPVSGHSAQQFKGLQIAFGKDPGEAETMTRKLQLENAQAAVKPRIELLDQVAKSDNAAQMVNASAPLRQLWNTAAQSYGISPAQMTDANVRRVMSARRNELAAWAQLPTEAPANQLRTVQTGLGGSYQVDDVSGKISSGAPQQETAQFMMPDGSVRMLTKAQGMARGLTPYNPSIYGAANMSDQAVQMAADTYRTTGKIPAAFGRNPLMQAKVLDRVAQDARANGDTAGAIAARAASLKANGQALDQITKLESNTTSYYSTLDKNLTALQGLAGKVDSSGVPLLNRVYRAWQQGISGDPQIAQYVTYLNAAQGEYAKIKSGSLGNQASSDAARKEAADVINKFMSQGQINAVADAMRGEGQNRLTSIREQKQALMGNLSSSAPGGATAAQAGPSPPPGVPMSNRKGWLLHHDAQGNWAYVSGDGKQFEAVK